MKPGTEASLCVPLHLMNIAMSGFHLVQLTLMTPLLKGLIEHLSASSEFFDKF
jgi:hypothetical protein